MMSEPAKKIAFSFVCKIFRVRYQVHARPSPWPSSTWRTFLEAHIGEIVALDFVVVPTLTFQWPSDS